jgi:hypothetical protein
MSQHQHHGRPIDDNADSSCEPSRKMARTGETRQSGGFSLPVGPTGGGGLPSSSYAQHLQQQQQQLVGLPYYQPGQSGGASNATHQTQAHNSTNTHGYSTTASLSSGTSVAATGTASPRHSHNITIMQEKT